MSDDGLAWLRPYLKAPRPVAASADLCAAVARYNADHRQDWARFGGTCPICGHHNCFGDARGKLANSGRWACFSANHGNIGVSLKACRHGDALDVDAFKAGRNRVDHLRALGYLTPVDTTQRLTRHDLLRTLGHTPDENEIEFLAERCAIRFYEGGQSLEAAERGALTDLLRHLKRNRGVSHA